MTFLTEHFAMLLVRATVALAASALLVRALIWWLQPSSPTAQRVAWFLVLAQGVVLFSVPIEISWHGPEPQVKPAVSAVPAADAAPIVAPPPEPATAADAMPPVDVRGGPRVAPVEPKGEPAASFRWSTMLLVIWLPGMVCLPACSLWMYARFLRRVFVGGPPQGDWLAEWQGLLDAHGIRRSILFRVSDDAGPALCWTPSGYRLVVPGPLWSELTRSQRLAVLRHELAHYRRADLWKMLLVRLLALPHWFNPLAWWAVRKFAECGEWACDRAAAGSEKAEATDYAKALLQLGTARVLPISHVAAMRGSPLFVRICRLMIGELPNDTVLKKSLLPGAVLGLLVFSMVRVDLVATAPVGREPEAERPAAAYGLKRLPWHPEELVAVLGTERGRQWRWINALALSPDGRQLASAGMGGSIWLWDAETLGPQGLLEGRTQQVVSLAYLSDGNRLVSVDHNGTLQTWDLSGEEPELRKTLVGSAPGTRAAWAGDGGTLATASSGEGIHVWDVGDEQVKQKLVIAEAASSSMAQLSPEEQQIARAFGARTVGAVGNSRTLAISRDGSLLALASGGAQIFMTAADPTRTKTIYRDSEVTLWDLSGSGPRAVGVPRKVVCVSSLAYSPDAKTLAVGSQNGELRLCRVSGAGWEEGALLKGEGALEVLAFSPDGTTLAGGGYRSRLLIWDLRGQKPVEHPVQPASLAGAGALVFHHDGGSLFASESMRVRIRRWDLDGSIPDRDDAALGHSDAVNSLGFTPDGKTLISAGSLDGTVRIWGFEGPLSKQQTVLKGWDGQADGVVLSPDGQRFVFETYQPSDYVLRLWDLSREMPKELDVLNLRRGHPGSFWCAAFTPDGATLATGHRDGAIRLWDVRDGVFNKGPSYHGAHANGVCSVDFSLDGKTLASGGWDRTVALWDVADSQIQLNRQLGKHDDIARQVAFSPDARLVASGDERGTIKLWDLTDREPKVRVLKQHDDLISSISFDAAGHRLLSTGRDGRAILWEVASGEVLREWKFPGPVWSGAFHPTGRYIVTGNGNGSIYVLRHLPQAKTPDERGPSARGS